MIVAEQSAAGSPQPTAPQSGLSLRVRDLRVTARGGEHLVSAPALDLPSGRMLGVRGPSGAGKSTLLRALSGLIDTATGHIAWGGDDLLAKSSAEKARFRRRSLALIFQDAALIDELGAAANAALPALFSPASERAEMRRRADAALRRLGVGAPARRSDRRSGGERQRIAVARALAGAPGAILADEPTASLDRATADALIADLTATARAGGVTLIVVSHDEAMLSAMDEVVAIVDGRLLDG